MDAPMIRVADLTVESAGRTRLGGVSLAADAGEIVGVIGPNGAGKSTLLGVLAGIERRWTGSITVIAREQRNWDRLAYAATVSYLPQEFRCEWALSVADLVRLGASRGQGFGWRAGSGEIKDSAWVYDAFDLAALRERIFNTLSGGEKARAVLAAAVAGRPPVLLADEPIASLDAYHQIEAMEHLRRLASEGTAVIIVLHDLTFAARYCDRLVLLDAGAVAATGRPNDVLRPETLARVYHVRALFGEHDGERYVVPWAQVEGEGP